MYKFIANIDNLSSFFVTKTILLCNKKNGRTLINGELVELEGQDLLGGYVNDDDVINITTKEFKCFYHSNLFSFLFKTIHREGLFDIKLNKSQYLACMQGCFSVYDLNKRDFIKTYPARFHTLYPSALFKEDLFFHKFPYPIIQSLSLLTGEFNWELDLGALYGWSGEGWDTGIQKVLGVYKNQLLVWTYQDQLISVDVELGTILYTLFPFDGLLNVNGNPVKGFYHLRLETEKGKIYMLEDYYYYEIDLETRTSRLLKSFYTRFPGDKVNEPTDIRFVQTAYTNDYIYFIGGVYHVGHDMVGAFNRHTYEIDWKIEVTDVWAENNYNSLLQVQYSNNKIYVLDGDGNLRIFEKE